MGKMSVLTLTFTITSAADVLYLGVLLVLNTLKCNDSLTLINCLHTGPEVTRCEDDVGIIYQG